MEVRMKARLWITVIIAAVLLNGCGNRSASGDRQNAAEDNRAETEGLKDDQTEIAATESDSAETEDTAAPVRKFSCQQC